MADTVTVKRAVELLGKAVRKSNRENPIPLVGGVAVVASVHYSGMVDLQCPCCRQPAGMYSAMDLELAP